MHMDLYFQTQKIWRQGLNCHNTTEQRNPYLLKTISVLYSFFNTVNFIEFIYFSIFYFCFSRRNSKSLLQLVVPKNFKTVVCKYKSTIARLSSIENDLT